MKLLDYTIQDEYGLHARPASLLVTLCQKFSSQITLQAGEKTADLKRLFAIMCMGIVQGESVTILIEGEDEAAAYDALTAHFSAHKV